ncbi:MAG: hypothetical protein ACI808_000599, partial [Paraglaciecola sp.]
TSVNSTNTGFLLTAHYTNEGVVFIKGKHHEI